MHSPGSVRRICKCGCNQTFPVPPKQPGREYKHGHKPQTAGAAQAPPSFERTMRETDGKRTLDYKIALRTARADLKRIADEIDRVDEEIEHLRKELKGREKQKDTLADRHLTVETAIVAMEALAEGKSLRAEIEAQEQTGVQG